MLNPIRFPILILSLAALCCQAQTAPQSEEKPQEPAYEGPVYIRPTFAPEAVSFKVVPFIRDGFRSTQAEVKCRLFAANTLPPKNWTQISIPGTSVAFQGTYYPNVKWSMSVWPPKRFLPDLTKASLTAYAEGIKQAYPEPDQVKILNYGSSYRAKAIPSVFNRSPRMLAYEITDPETGAVTLRHDNFVLFKNYVLEFSIWGPPREVKSMLGWFSVIPENLSLTTPDTTYDQDIANSKNSASLRAKVEAMNAEKDSNSTASNGATAAP